MAGRQVIRLEWDDEAKLWVASSDDITGLATEGEIVEGVIERALAVIPELLKLNGREADISIPIHIMADRVERLKIAS